MIKQVIFAVLRDDFSLIRRRRVSLPARKAETDPRYKTIRVKYQDNSFAWKTASYTGFTAQIKGTRSTNATEY